MNAPIPAEPVPPSKPLLRQWWVWALAAVVVLAVAAAVVVNATQNSDGAKTSQLRDYLERNYRYEAGIGDSYSGLGTVTYQDGNVTVDAPAWHDSDYGAYLYCAWVEPWLLSNGTEDSQITVKMGGEVFLQTHNSSESCEDASYNAKYGG